MIGAETYAQSDDYWTCRIRRMLRQTLNCIFDIYVDQCKLSSTNYLRILTPVTTCTDYIHNNYQNDITLSFLCELVHLNRTTLNQRFKQQVNCTCIEYLLHYRLKISQELLSNTNLKIDDIATQCGFKYSSYFNRQFTKCLESHLLNLERILQGIACLMVERLVNYEHIVSSHLMIR